MSGIIGGAGSRSGIIGETELDYEEGTYTPALSDGGSSFTYNTGDWGTFGEYVKIGNVVHVAGRVVLTGGTMTDGTVTITLPFNQAGAGTGDVPMFSMYLAASGSMPSDFTYVAAHLNTNTATISTRAVRSTGDQIAFQGSHFSNSGNINFHGHYRINAG